MTGPSIPETLNNHRTTDEAAVARLGATGVGGHELSREEKTTAIRGIVTDAFDGELPDAFYCLSGGLKQKSNGVWRTLAYGDLGEHGLTTGSRTRVIATAAVGRAFPGLRIIPNSYNRFDPKEPTMASVMDKELVVRGVHPTQIEREEQSFSTVTQLVEMIRTAVARGWTNVAAMSNEWHVPRIREMVDRLDTIVDDEQFQKDLATFKERDGRIALVPAEPILRILDTKFASYLDAAAKMPEYAQTMAAEAQGLRDLRDGKYRVVLTAEKPRS